MRVRVRRSPGLRPGSRRSGSNLGHFFLKQISRPHFQCLGNLPDREQGRVLQPSFHAAYEGPVNAHAFRNRLLAQAKA